MEPFEHARPEDDGGDAYPSRLRRVRLAIVSRDWFGIAIELIVVTVGVLFAFEAQQWGEQLGRHRDEREFLERLYGETGEGARELQDLIRIHQRGVAELGAVLRARNDPKRLAQYANAQGFGCIVGTLPTAGYNDTASEELISSGRISTISDRKLRDAVRRLAARQAEGQRQLDYARQVTGATTTPILPYNRYELRNGESRMRCTIDWPNLVANPTSAAVLARAYRIHQLMLEIRSDTLAATTDVHSKLACALNKPPCHQ